MHPRLHGLSVPFAVVLVLFQLAVPIVIASQDGTFARREIASKSDTARYREIVRHPGTPYRDFDVEYPPGALAVFRAAGPRTYDGFRHRLFALQVVCQALIVFLLFRFWSGRTGWSYLLLSAPMLFVVYSGFDLVSVALAVGAATLLKERHPVAGGTGFVAGAFTKLWPVVLLPSLLIARRARAFTTAIVTGVVGLGAWIAWGGPGGVGQVVSYRGAHGWEFESVPGSLLRLLTRAPLRFEAGSWRVGAPPRALSVVFALVLLGVVSGIWWLAAQRPALPGVAETGAIAAVLVCGTLLSPQFAIWVMPFAAIAAAGGARGIERWALAVGLLTLLDRIVFDPAHPALVRTELVVLGRNVVLVGLLVAAIRELRPVAVSPKVPVAA
jgi:hypothetical protein